MKLHGEFYLVLFYINCVGLLAFAVFGFFLGAAMPGVSLGKLTRSFWRSVVAPSLPRPSTFRKNNTKGVSMSAAPTPDNSQSSEGQIWPVNDPPLVLTPGAPSDDSASEEGVIEPVNDPVTTLRKTDPS